MHKMRIEPFDCIQIPGKPDAMTVVLFHGFGASCYDLAPLAHELSQPIDANWYFPDGPLPVAIAPGMSGKAWFPIDGAALQAAIANGTFRKLSELRPAGLDEALKMGAQFLQQLAIPPARLILGGFSQGAMLATEISLRMQSNPAALIILSGTMLDKTTWKSLASRRTGMPFFQSHGNQDPLLDPASAAELNDLLVNAGLKGELIQFEGGHEIPTRVLSALQKFLRQINEQYRPGS